MNAVAVAQLGEARYRSPIPFSISDDLFTPSDVEWRAGQIPDDMMLFEKAGPREKLFFKPSETRAAIVTCGGLCPGLNNVIRSVTRELFRGYGVKSVLGIHGGYRGLDPSRGKPTLELTEDKVEDIHKS
ncbi:MAG: 6-phosphofructokinase, partial [Rubrivivax sp.]|nr:6-phosphofructokinase [Rubrivivax sp.]